MQSVFEKYPLPWAVCKSTPDGEYSSVICTATGDRVHYFEWALGSLGEEIYSRVVEDANALNGIENPVQWVSDLTDIQFEHVDLLKEYAKQKQRIAELEQQLAKQPETIKAAISFFTMSNIPLKYVEKWMSGIDPTAPEEQ